MAEANVQAVDCCVCKETLTGSVPIYQCSNGHLLCGTCFSSQNFTQCPACRVNMAGKWVRSRELEQVYRTTNASPRPNNPDPAPHMAYSGGASGCHESFDRELGGPQRSGTKVYVKTMTGKNMGFEVDLSMRVEGLMAMIQEVEGTPASEQRLLFNGRQLEAGRTLAQYGIRDRSFIQLVIRQLGGSSC